MIRRSAGGLFSHVGVPTSQNRLFVRVGTHTCKRAGREQARVFLLMTYAFKNRPPQQQPPNLTRLTAAVFVPVYMCTYGGGLHADLSLSLLPQLFLWMMIVNWVW